MSRMFQVLLVTMVVFQALPASAQTAPAGASGPTDPTVRLWYLGATGGAASVEKVGGTAGMEGGIRVWKNIDAIGEFQWVGNAVTGRQLGKITTLADELSRTTGLPASGTMEVPTYYLGLGLRWVFEQEGRYRPYLVATFGGAHVNLKPTLTLDGNDVTDQAADYLITLGQDVIGEYNKAAVSGGFGLVIPYGQWYFDSSLRVLSISGTEQRTNVIRLSFGGGARF